MKLLFITNLAGKKVGSFSLTSIMAAKKLGYEYHLAANFMNSTPEQMKSDEEEFGIKLHQIDFERNPVNTGNRKAYRQVVDLIEAEKIDVIHCNTPIGGVVGRLAGTKCKVPKVIYQAHGFHFYNGAPWRNWLLYYPVERLLAHYTDALITINHEDYERAQKFHLRNNGKVYYVPGVGIKTNEFEYEDDSRNDVLKELKIGVDSSLIISVGELNKNKNNEVVLKALNILKDDSIHYLVCGDGPLKDHLNNIAMDIGVQRNVHFLGYRTDVKRLLYASDIFILPSYREGLSRSLMEAMAIGLPCVVSSIRGNIDLVSSMKNGFLCDPNSANEFAKAISQLIHDPTERKKYGESSKELIKKFDIAFVTKELRRIYE